MFAQLRWEEDVELGASLQQGHSGLHGRSCQAALLFEARDDTTDCRESWSSIIPGSELLLELQNGTWVNSMATAPKRPIRDRLELKRRGLTCSRPAAQDKKQEFKMFIVRNEQGSGGS